MDWSLCYNPVNGREFQSGLRTTFSLATEQVQLWPYLLTMSVTGNLLNSLVFPIVEVLEGGNVEEAAYTEDGPHVNSDFLNGLNKEEAIAKIVAWLEEKGFGQEKITYRLRDWLFSRQRYWGEPIPIIHWEDGTSTAVPESELPLVLPVTKDIRPSGTGESPIRLT